MIEEGLLSVIIIWILKSKREFSVIKRKYLKKREFD